MKTFLFLFVLLFLLSACTQETTTDTLATSCPPDCSGGDTGIVTTINTPQDEGTVYVGDRLAPSVTLDDTGESSVEGGLVCITGLDGAIFSGLGGCNCQSFYTTIDDPHDANFQQATVNFQGSLLTDEGVGDQHMTFYTRYSYSTYGPFTLCLTGDPYHETDCSVEGDKLTSSSSGPVQITSVTESITTQGSNSVNVRLKIDVDKPTSDTGQLVSIEQTSEPSCVLPTSDTVSADVSVILFGEAHDCGTITFNSDEESASVTCKLDSIDTQNFIGGQKDYDGWVRIDYGYQELQSVAFTVSGQ